MDATTFTVGRDLKGTVTVDYLVKEEGKPLKAMPDTKQKGSPTGLYTIKYYLLMNAIGTTSIPVYLFADERMDKEICDVYEVPGLGIGTDMTQKGFMVFCQSRAGNENFYKWFNDMVLIPYVTAIRKAHGLGNDFKAFLHLDGEDIQIRLYGDTLVLEKLREEGILVGKLPGSTTEVTQAADAGNCFKGPKTQLKFITEKDVAHFRHLQQLITNVVKQQEEKYKSRGKISANHKTNIVHGLIRIVYALQNCMRPRMIIESFEKSGMKDFSLEKILKLCTTPMTAEEERLVYDAWPNLLKIMRTKGEISDASFASLGFYGESKDHLILSRRRAVFLTNMTFIQNEYEKAERKAQTTIAAAEKKRMAAEKRAATKARKAFLVALDEVADVATEFDDQEVGDI
jgi:hypothetical protein